MYEYEEVPESEAKSFAKEIGAIYQTTSAKVASGVDELYFSINLFIGSLKIVITIPCFFFKYIFELLLLWLKLFYFFKIRQSVDFLCKKRYILFIKF